MRHWLVLPVAFAATLVVAAPAWAQRVSLADRVAALEARAGDTSANVDMLNQVNQLRQEILALRSQVEELQQQNEQLKSSNRSQYLDIDGRLNRLESGQGGGGGLELPDLSSAPAPAAGANAQAARGGRDAPAAAAPVAAAPADERAAYEQAFNALKNGQYTDSARLFQAFLQTYPQGSYAPNALYWLGESYYVTQNYARSQEQFLSLLQRYPQSDKAPGAMLKVGLSQYGLKDLDGAEATLADVGKQYPGTDAARTAADRLRAIQLSRLR
ncbi:tol-pal system protein YbgF [Luteimonas sp. 100069]|uniref:tol-pal system protein YbgF n=1 Tax=Luteimonas sp. 100069 TaxID=2006109 RepID=UPI000F50B1A8|nr:tol-pal system protein YbgF [Luteimonas sp. 100069]RPD88786.1 tol-pal system protein YbgF [Luteimonas sp. 100069]